jgi:hypothetical protein
MESAHAQAFRDAALSLFDQPDIPLGTQLPLLVGHARVISPPFLAACMRVGVMSTETVVDLINKVSGAVHLKELSKQDLIGRVFELLIGQADVIEQDELLVRAGRTSPRPSASCTSLNHNTARSLAGGSQSARSSCRAGTPQLPFGPSAPEGSRSFASRDHYLAHHGHGRTSEHTSPDGGKVERGAHTTHIL